MIPAISPAAALLLVALLLPRGARANTPDDLFGMGARTVAMGGSGTALATDFAAVYYNPANMSFCPTNQVSLTMAQLAYDVEVAGAVGTEEEPFAGGDDQSRVTFGFCSHLPYGLSFGIGYGVGVQHAMTLDQHTVDGSRMSLHYGLPLEQMTILAGLAFRPFETVSIGGGVSVLVNSELGVPLEVPLLTADETIAAGIRWELKPTTAVYVGAHVVPLPRLHLGASYHSALYHKLDTISTIDLNAVGIAVPAEILLEAVSWYSPQQASFGATYDVTSYITLSADVAWQDWSSYPGPFVVVSPNNNVAASAINFPEPEDLALRDIIIPRAGGEWRLAPQIGGDLALRAGFSYRPAVTPVPGTVMQQRTAEDGTPYEEPGVTNVLDNAVTSFMIGAGYRYGDKPSVTPAPRWKGGPEEHGASLGFDLYVRAGLLSERSVPDRDGAEAGFEPYTFGGAVYDAGVTFTLGWY